MSCEVYLELISARLDGELTADRQAELDAHLTLCPDCRAIAHDLNHIHGVVAPMQAEPPARLAQGVMERIRTQKAAARWRTLRQIGSLAAAVVLCIGLYRITDADLLRTKNSGAAAPESSSILADDAAYFHYAGTTTGLYADTTEKNRTAADQEAEQESKTSAESLAAPTSDGVCSFAFSSPRYLRVTYGSTPAAPCARVIGDRTALEEYVAAFPGDDLSHLTASYDEAFFRDNRLLAVVVEEPSGSITHRLESVTASRVTVVRMVPQAGTADMAAWLILAQLKNDLIPRDVLTPDSTLAVDLIG